MLPACAVAAILPIGGAALGSAPAEAREAARESLFNARIFTLKNGLRGVVIVNRRAPVALHMLWYKVGAIDEPAGNSGIAHFLEHLLFKGTKTLKNGEFSKIVAANGGRENAFTSWDYTGYYQFVAKDRLARMMEIEADRMANLVLSKGDVVQERRVILEERRSRIDARPSSILWEQARRALYLNHRYGRPIIGWMHEMERLSRQDALNFYKRYYGPNNAVLVVAGDVDPDEVRRLAEKYYGAVPRAKLPPRRKLLDPPQRAERRVIYRDPPGSPTVLQPNVLCARLQQRRRTARLRFAGAGAAPGLVVDQPALPEPGGQAKTGHNGRQRLRRQPPRPVQL